MVCGPLADHRLGGIPARLPRHAVETERAAHLCGELVLPVLHRDHRDAAHRQQPVDPGFLDRHEVGAGLCRRARCHDAMVVWPQRGRLLPDHRLPRHHVLLHSEAGEPAGLFLPPVDRPLLEPDLHLHLGRTTPPALHGAAAMGADPRYDLLNHALDAQLGRHDQRCHDPVGRLGQAAH